MTQDEIIRMAQKAGLVPDEDYGYLEWWYFAKLIAAHEREALAEQDKQEPVYAFRRRGLDDFCTCTKERYEELVDKPNLFEVTTYYAAPVTAKREWVELTDDEILAAVENCPLDNRIEAAKAGITAFKEKNK